MELLEYQAKELFRTVDIPILASQTIKDSRKIKQLQIPYPVVLKSQVKSGGRGKAGGVRFVANTIDAIAAARTIFNLSILGEYPEVILAEAHYNTEREFFLAIVLDYDLKRPVLLGSAYGGMNIDSLLSNLQQVVIDTEFSLFQARRLAAKMGLSGKLIVSVSDIVAKMYSLFCSKDLDLIEINPLGVNKRGELMALDGKITVNNSALARQPIIASLNFAESQKQVEQYDSLSKNKDLNHIGWRWLDWQNQKGKVAIICNNADLGLLTWDLLSQNKVTPACGVLIENSLMGEINAPQLYQTQLEQILTEFSLLKGIKAVLVNIWATETVSNAVIQAIASYHEHCCQSLAEESLPLNQEQVLVKSVVKSNQQNSVSAEGGKAKETLIQRKSGELQSKPLNQPKFILRLLTQDNWQDSLSTEAIYAAKTLEGAIAQTITIVKSS